MYPIAAAADRIWAGGPQDYLIVGVVIAGITVLNIVGLIQRRRREDGEP